MIEGHDGGGKTTLGDRLRKRHGATVYHCGYRFRDNIFAFHAAVLRRAVAESATRLVVIDRLWMSEAVYAAVYRGGTRWPHQGRMVDRVLLRWGAVNVICATDPDAAVAMTNGRPGMHHDARQAYVCQHFLGVRTPTVTLPETYLGDLQRHAVRRPDVVGYDYRGNIESAELDTYVDELVKHAVDRRAALIATARDPANLNLLGNSNLASVVMVGDRTNAKNAKIAWPFFEYANSSLYLARACHVAGLQERDLMWLNAHDDSARETVFTLAGLGLNFAALGQEAAARLALWGIRHRGVRHPQAARRFAHRDLDGYARELTHAVKDAGW